MRAFTTLAMSAALLAAWPVREGRAADGVRGLACDSTIRAEPDTEEERTRKCQEWNVRRVADALAFIVAEAERGNRHALVLPEGVAVQGANGASVPAICSGVGGRHTTTGCTDGTNILVNVDRPIEAVAQTIVHEVQHVIGKKTERGMERCADARGAGFVLGMEMASYTRATTDPEVYTEPSVPAGYCGF